MKKYKLIREYPKSPKLGNEKYDNWENTINSLANYPEFWEEIIEKNYKILELYNKEDDAYCFLRKDNTYCYKQFNKNGSTLEECLKEDWIIYKVKNLKNNEIFKINDITDFGKIKGFEVKKNQIIVLFNRKGNWQFLSSIKKYLFTTEDDFKIFKGDLCWGVNLNNFNIYQVNTINDLQYKHNYTFATKQNAKKYVIMNKPCISLNYIFNNSNILEDSVIGRELLELVKSRIK